VGYSISRKSFWRGGQEKGENTAKGRDTRLRVKLCMPDLNYQRSFGSLPIHEQREEVRTRWGVEKRDVRVNDNSFKWGVNLVTWKRFLRSGGEADGKLSAKGEKIAMFWGSGLY